MTHEVPPLDSGMIAAGSWLAYWYLAARRARVV